MTVPKIKAVKFIELILLSHCFNIPKTNVVAEKIILQKQQHHI